MRVALVSLAVALLAVSGSHSQSTVHVCGPAGTAIGFATIRPFPPSAAGQIKGAFTRAPFYFIRRYNCRGLGVEVRRLATGVYDLRFPGLRPRAIAGVALVEGSVSAAMQPLNDIVRVRLFRGKDPVDGAFSVVIY